MYSPLRKRLIGKWAKTRRMRLSGKWSSLPSSCLFSVILGKSEYHKQVALASARNATGESENGFEKRSSSRGG